MIPRLEKYVLAESFEEAFASFEEFGAGAHPIAGGTELIESPPESLRCLVDITQLGLDQVEVLEGRLKLGATLTMSDVAVSPYALALASGILVQATLQGWPSHIRSAATLGGNIAGGAPFSDLPTALVALDSGVEVRGRGSFRTILAEDFFVGYRQTALKEELVTAIEIPMNWISYRGLFLKVGQHRLDRPLLNMALLAKVEEDKIEDLRVVVGAALCPPQRATRVEELCIGQAWAPKLAERASKEMAYWLEPMVDLRCSGEQRKELAGEMIAKGLSSLMKAG